jgi:hypothetical protein
MRSKATKYFLWPLTRLVLDWGSSKVTMTVALVVVTLLSGIVACASVGSEITPAPKPAHTPASPAEPTSTTGPKIGGTEGPSAEVIQYHRSGGFLGLDDRLVIYNDGQAKVTRKAKACSSKVDPATTDKVRRLLAEAEFSNLRKTYFPARQGADLFTYVLTHKGHTVQAMDTTVPESLWPILELLNPIIETC